MITLTKLVCPVDFSDTSRHAFEYAATLAHKFSSELVLMHVMEEVPLLSAYSGHAEVDEVKDIEDAARGQIAAWISAARHDGLNVRVAILHGHTEDAIVEFCAGEMPGMLVMGTHGRRFLDAALFGSVTERVIRRVACPVLLVRLPADGVAYEEVRK